MSTQQNKNIMLTVVVCVLVMVVFIGLRVWTLQRPQPFTTAQQSAVNTLLFEQPRIVPDMPLNRHDGSIFQTSDFASGGWTFIFPGFTHCPDICPATLATLNKAILGVKKADESAEIPAVMMLSLDPARDTTDVLSQYVPYFNPEFIGLQTNLKDTTRLAIALNIAFTPVGMSEGEEYSIDHSGNIVLIGPQGHYRGFVKPPFDVVKLQTLIQRLAHHQ